MGPTIVLEGERATVLNVREIVGIQDITAAPQTPAHVQGGAPPQWQRGDGIEIKEMKHAS
jgi:hypothetical protein